MRPRLLALVMGIALCLGAGVERTPGVSPTPAVTLPAKMTASWTLPAGRALFVATDGHDGNPGTEGLPFRTLARGVVELAPGDILYVKQGVYVEALVHTIPPGESWSRPVTVAAYPGHAVTLQPAAGEPGVLRFIAPQAYIVVRGFVLDATNVRHDAVKITATATDGQSAHHIRIQDCEVKNAPNQGILTSGGAHSNEFINLDVHDNGLTDFEHGIYLASDGNVVEGSKVHRNAGWGIHVYNQRPGGSANFNVIRNNRVFNNARVGARGAGILLSSGKGHQAYNNLVWGNVRGIQLGPDTLDAVVYHNVVYANRGHGLFVSPGSVNARIHNNIIWQNAGADYLNTGRKTINTHNLIGLDPGFLDANAGNFRLRANSPAIDAGTLLGSITTDIAGARRWQGDAPDIGAYELRDPADAIRPERARNDRRGR